MKYFLDTEFIERPNQIDLISIGLVCEDGREYYSISTEYNYYKASDWVKENVILPMYLQEVNGDNRNRFDVAFFQRSYGRTLLQIRKDLLDFIQVTKYEKPEFWGYYSDYDWVVFCWIFGKMIDLPKGYPMYCNNLQQLYDNNDIEVVITEQKNEHNALDDARWNKEFYSSMLRELSILKLNNL